MVVPTRLVCSLWATWLIIYKLKKHYFFQYLKDSKTVYHKMFSLHTLKGNHVK